MSNLYGPKNLKELSQDLFNIESPYLIVNGCTDVLVQESLSTINDSSILDLSQVKELKEIAKEEKYLILGSGLTMSEISMNYYVVKYFEALSLAAKVVGSPQIRNRATIGGNMANCAPCADTVTALMSFDANIEILNSEGLYRQVNIKEVIKGFKQNKLEENEIITKIILPIKKSVSSFKKLGQRKEVTISKINMSVNLILNDANIIESANCYVGALNPVPVKAVDIENMLVGVNLFEVDMEKIKELSARLVDDQIPNRESKWYKRIAIQGIVEDLIEEIQLKRGETYVK